MGRGHHVLFEKRIWDAHEPNRELRRKSGLIVPMYSDEHDALHKEVTMVPVPNYRLGQAILSIYRDNPDDHIRSIENLIRAADQAIGHPRMKPIERALGELFIEAVELQLPFIRGGLRREG